MTQTTRRLTWGIGIVLVGLGIAYFWLKSGPADLAVPVSATVTHQSVPYEVSVSRNQEAITPTARHRFIVRRDQKLEELTDVERYPHVAVVSHDLSDITFYHVDRMANPSKGVFEFDHDYTAASPYTLWFEINDNSLPNHMHHGTLSDYISEIDIGNPSTVEAVPDRLVARDGEYQLELEPVRLAVGQPSELKIHAKDSSGNAVPLVTDIDHFYFVADPSNDFYILDHPDLTLTAGPTITINKLTFPRAGTYALWARVIVSDADNEPADLIEGSFVLTVR